MWEHPKEEPVKRHANLKRNVVSDWKALFIERMRDGSLMTPRPSLCSKTQLLQIKKTNENSLTYLANVPHEGSDPTTNNM